MSRRRRKYLLLALLPATLGVATLAFMGGQTQTQAEYFVPAPAAQEAEPQVVQEGSISLPAGAPVEAAGGTTYVEEPEAPASEEPASDPRPVQVEADEAAGPARYAGAGPIEAVDSAPSWARGSYRLASLDGFVGGGGRSRGSNDTKDPGTPQNPPADEGSPDAGPNNGGGTGENSPGTHSPDDTGKPGDTDQGGGPDIGTPSEGGEPDEGEEPGDEGGGGGGLPPLDPDPKEPVQVPEPATIGLFALGLLGCAARRKSRK